MGRVSGVYDEKYAAKYGMFRLERTRDIGGRFLMWGDYRLGVARIRCTNPTYGHDYFRPFSCKGFYLCPSCSQNASGILQSTFKENVHLFDALDFLAELTQHIPPKRLQLIRRYGLYASRTKGRWEDMPWVAERAPDGWKATHQHPTGGEDIAYEALSDEEEEVGVNARKRAWARLLAKVYEVDPFVCPRMHAPRETCVCLPARTLPQQP